MAALAAAAPHPAVAADAAAATQPVSADPTATPAWTPLHYVGLAAVALNAFTGAATGQSGAQILVPVAVLCALMSVGDAAAFAVLVSALGAVPSLADALAARNPISMSPSDASSLRPPAVDYRALALGMPVLLFGVKLGTLANMSFPSFLLTMMLIALYAGAAVDLTLSYVQLLKRERERDALLKQVEQRLTRSDELGRQAAARRAEEEGQEDDEDDDVAAAIVVEGAVPAHQPPPPPGDALRAEQLALRRDLERLQALSREIVAREARGMHGGALDLTLDAGLLAAFQAQEWREMQGSDERRRRKKKKKNKRTDDEHDDDEEATTTAASSSDAASDEVALAPASRARGRSFYPGGGLASAAANPSGPSSSAQTLDALARQLIATAHEHERVRRVRRVREAALGDERYVQHAAAATGSRASLGQSSSGVGGRQRSSAAARLASSLRSAASEVEGSRWPSGAALGWPLRATSHATNDGSAAPTSTVASFVVASRGAGSGASLASLRAAFGGGSRGGGVGGGGEGGCSVSSSAAGGPPVGRATSDLLSVSSGAQQQAWELLARQQQQQRRRQLGEGRGDIERGGSSNNKARGAATDDDDYDGREAWIVQEEDEEEDEDEQEQQHQEKEEQARGRLSATAWLARRRSAFSIFWRTLPKFEASAILLSYLAFLGFAIGAELAYPHAPCKLGALMVRLAFAATMVAITVVVVVRILRETRRQHEDEKEQEQGNERGGKEEEEKDEAAVVQPPAVVHGRHEARIDFTSPSLALACAPVSLGVGALGASVGAAGSVIIQPLALRLGVAPGVIAASSKLLLFASTSASAISLALAGRTVPPFTIASALLTFVLTPLGQWAADAVVRKRRRPSIIIAINIARYLLGVALLAGAVLAPLLRELAVARATGEPLPAEARFRSPCG
jgi:uncharacterized membrane protein YfcA